MPRNIGRGEDVQPNDLLDDAPVLVKVPEGPDDDDLANDGAGDDAVLVSMGRGA